MGDTRDEPRVMDVLHHTNRRVMGRVKLLELLWPAKIHLPAKPFQVMDQLGAFNETTRCMFNTSVSLATSQVT